MRECAPPRRARARGRDAGTRARVPSRQCPVPRTDGRHSSARLDVPVRRGARRRGTGEPDRRRHAGATPRQRSVDRLGAAARRHDRRLSTRRAIRRRFGGTGRDGTHRAPLPPSPGACRLDRHDELRPLRHARAAAGGRYTARRARDARRGRAATTAVGATIPFIPDTLPGEPAWGVRAFATTATAYRLPPAADRYVAWLPAAPLCPDGKSACATLEAVAGQDTATAAWPLTVGPIDLAFPTVVVLNDDTAHTGTTDSLTVGKSVPGGTYNWFFPTGTTAVLSGRWNDQARLQLSKSSAVWVNAADVVPLPVGSPPPGGVVGSVRLQPGPASITLRVPLPGKLPFQVTEQERSLTLRLYGVASDINWMQYGGTDPLVTRMSYAQPAADEVTITLELARRVWGYRTRFDGRDLLLEIRRPPAIDPDRPLKGRTIVLDPGHPPVGATGPTGLWEPVATLAIALKAKALLEQAGATVLLTRTDSLPVDLFPRTHFAELHDADVLVSIHANALPDGVNPFVNNGTSVYYFHPRSAPLARALDRALVTELGVRDLGMGRGDYALVRPTWMPAALTEGLFIMLPEQEAMLRSDEG